MNRRMATPHYEIQRRWDHAAIVASTFLVGVLCGVCIGYGWASL